MALALLAVGSILSLIGWVWILVGAFKNGDIGWGIASFFCGLAAIVYGFQHDALKVPALMMLGGVVLSVVGNVMGGAGAVQ